ncbi:unnamed protein product, partial [Trypanosoma congolense IL3000]
RRTGEEIFGDEAGKAGLNDLQSKLPEDYKVKGKLSSRAFLCGQKREGGHTRVLQPRWPGHSASHDLVCLCTAGDHGWPINGTGRSKQRLCGKTPSELGVENDKKGWSYKENEGEAQIQATWAKVVAECLKGSGRGENLKHALQTFMGKLNHKPLPQPKDENRYLLGEGDGGEYSCGGNGKVCVIYYNSTSPMPWWTDLENALKTEEHIEQEKKGEEKETKKETQKHQKSQNQQQPQNNVAPRTAALRSSNPEKQEEEQDNTQNISSPIATIEQSGSTHITPPSSWLLCGVLII